MRVSDVIACAKACSVSVCYARDDSNRFSEMGGWPASSIVYQEKNPQVFPDYKLREFSQLRVLFVKEKKRPHVKGVFLVLARV